MGAALGISSCSEKMEDFGNKVSTLESTEISTLLLNDENDVETRTVTAHIYKREVTPVTVTYGVNPAAVDAFNTIYGYEAQLLPSDHYNIAKPGTTILPGAIESAPVEVTFTGLRSLDPEKVYVLPVAIISSSLPLLDSAVTNYFMIRGAAIINYVASGIDNGFGFVNPGNATSLASLPQFTAEALLYINEPGGEEAGIQTILGVEEYFLLRIGDAGVEPDQLQLSTQAGKFTDPSWKMVYRRWFHFALTFDHGTATLYIDGQPKATLQTAFTDPVNWNRDDFYVGRSCGMHRWLNGNFSEVRIWNRCLSADELNAKNHFYRVDATSPGLVAYWKFNEGAGNLITDFTNGYNLQPDAKIDWIDVKLP